MTPFVSTPPPFDAITAGGIGGLALAMAAIVAWLRGRFEGAATGARSAVVLAMWIALVGGAAAAGVLARFDRTPPPMALLLPVIFGGSIVLALSAVGRSMAQAWPLAALVGVQMFRLPLELVMHRAARLGIMPEELSYSGYNLDIVTGATAVVIVALMARRPLPRAVLWAWNLWGVWCLLVIAWVARTSSPLVRGFGDDPRHVNTWVLYLPYVWLPAVLVMIALTGHLVLTRKLLTTSPARSYTSTHR